METTTIQVSEELWLALNKKKFVAESFEEVIWRLTKLKKEKND
jgi:predicted CopG family antitoxin